jgi:hypothetical protein
MSHSRSQSRFWPFTFLFVCLMVFNVILTSTMIKVKRDLSQGHLDLKKEKIEVNISRLWKEGVMVFNTTFKNISVISWCSVLLFQTWIARLGIKSVWGYEKECNICLLNYISFWRKKTFYQKDCNGGLSGLSNWTLLTIS